MTRDENKTVSKVAALLCERFVVRIRYLFSTRSRISVTMSCGVHFVVQAGLPDLRSLRRRRVTPASSGIFDPARLTETTLCFSLLWCRQGGERPRRRAPWARETSSPGDRSGLALSESTGMAAGARSVDIDRSGDSRRPAPLAAPAFRLLTAPSGHRQSDALPSPRSLHPRGRPFASRRSLRSRLGSLATDHPGRAGTLRAASARSGLTCACPRCRGAIESRVKRRISECPCTKSTASTAVPTG